MTTLEMITLTANLLCIGLYVQVAALGLWLLAHFHHIGTRREIRDNCIVSIVAAGYVIVHVAMFWNGTINGCGYSWLGASSPIISLALGWFINSSLDRRLSFYLFCAQENKRRVHNGTVSAPR